MMRRILCIALSVCVLCCSPLQAEAMSVSDINISSELFTYEQRRINQEILSIASSVANKAHFTKNYKVETRAFKSFAEYFDPLMLLSMTCSEWGGHARFDYSWTPAIATKDIANVGLKPWQVKVEMINSEYYIANGISVEDKGSKYLGPLQINKSYFPSRYLKYECGNVPMDYYSWRDQVEWYVHSYGAYMEKTVHPDYLYKNKYEVIAHCSIMANTGPAYTAFKKFDAGSGAAYPWLEDTTSVFKYVEDITTESNVEIIRQSAKAFYEKRIEEVKNGSITSYNNIQLSRYEANKLLSQMGLDAAKYVKSQYVSTAFTNSPQQPNEKLAHPICSMWSYMVLEMLYTSGRS